MKGEWLSVKEAAESLGVGSTAVYKLVAEKKLACYRTGVNKGRILFKPSDLADYVESCRVDPGGRPKAARPKAREPYVPKYEFGGKRRPG